MRAISSELQAHFDSGATTLCHCWRVERRDGAVLGFTDHDRALAFAGDNYEPETGADGADIEASADLAVDNSEIEGALTSDRLSAADLAAGRYDGASVEIWRVNWADVDQRLLLKKAAVGEVSREGGRFRAELRGLSHHLDRDVGRVYQRQCDAVLGDARCGVDLTGAALSAAGTVSGLIGAERFTVSGLSGFAGRWFEHGVLTWVTGANAGDNALIKAHHGDGSISLWLPASAIIAAGDQFTVTAGCDKRSETCAAKFSNMVNFRGFHLMPGNDFAIRVPLRSDKNDGAKR